MISVLAIYPQTPLKPLRPRTPEEEDFERRLKATKTLEEAFAVMDTAPQSAEEFDVVKAMNETRRLTGFRMPDPEPEEADCREGCSGTGFRPTRSPV